MINRPHLFQAITPEDVEPFSNEEAVLLADERQGLWALWYDFEERETGEDRS